MPDELGQGDTLHELVISNRERLRVTGVVHVVSFDERQVALETEAGLLTIEGEDFHITTVDLDKGNLQLEGLIASLEYSPVDRAREKRQKERGLLARIFR
jgi:sporulation protein YabP